METVVTYFAVLAQYFMYAETNLLQRAVASTQIKKEQGRKGDNTSGQVGTSNKFL
jgi:hypothetical protein